MEEFEKNCQIIDTEMNSSKEEVEAALKLKSATG